MLPDAEVEFSDRRYGKNYVRLLHVSRDGGWHRVKEVEVNSKLTLRTTKDFVTGDNSDIVATDSQKNTVYILAKQFGIPTIEEFAMRLSQHFLTQYSHVDAAYIYVEEKPWNRIKQGGTDHAHAFVAEGGATRFCNVEQHRGAAPQLTAGLKDLKVMKTTQSGFVNFVKDEYRSLPDMDDRVFATIVSAEWKYGSLQGLDFDRAWSAVQSSVLDVFAGPPKTGVFSPSVQKTLYETQKTAMAKVPQISEMKIELPNVHAYAVDYAKFPAFGITKNEEVFQPVDKPSGNIAATLRRKVAAKL